MYLKAVEIYGFKSFGEKVYIEFNRGLTSIVGPNGSGKSNILDAVLWVLGEQSYKNIRAKESSDVIFSGGKDKKPMNFAEVSLFISNEDRYLPYESDEIKITRKLHNSGDNEYFINDTKSRLKDIGTLFLDTGIGKSAYSVIGQGKVERIIGSSSKEIKSIIEEAAGIKKFQIQKNEATKNLSNLDNELEKLELVLNEVNENTSKIEKQANKAKEYLELKDRYNSLSKGIYIVEKEKKTKELEIITSENACLNEKLEEFSNKHSEIVKTLNEIDMKKQEIKSYIDSNLEKNQELKNSIDSAEKEEFKICERINSIKKEILDKKENHQLIDEKINNKNLEIDKLKNSIIEVNEELEKLNSVNQEYGLLKNNLETNKSELSLNINSKKKSIMEFELKKLELINEIEDSTKRIKGSSSKINSLNSECEEYDKKINSILLEYNKANKEMEILKKEFDTLDDREVFLENEISKISQNMNKISEFLRNSQYNKSIFSSKLEALVKMEENNVGYFKGVKEVLNANIPGVVGVFISLVSIPEKFEKAILAGVPGNIQDIVVENSQVAKKAIEVLKMKKVGKASFLALDTLKIGAEKTAPKLEGVYGIARDLVTIDSKYKKIIDFVLGSLLIVENMDIALKIIKDSLFSGNVVTLSGELISSRGRITGGDNGNTSASQIFERKKEIKNLTQQIEEIDCNLEKYSRQQDEFSSKLEKIETELSNFNTNKENLRKKLKTSQEDLDFIISRKERLEKERKTIQFDLENEMRYSKDFESRINNSTNKKSELENIIALLNKEYDDLIEQSNNNDVQLLKIQNEYSDKIILFSNTKNNLKNLEIQIENIENEKKELLENRNKLNSTIALLKENIESLEEKKMVLNNEISHKLEIYNNENLHLNNIKNENDNLTVKERELFKEKTDVESSILYQNNSISKAKDRITRLSNDLEKIQDSLSALNDVEEFKIVEEELEKEKLRFKNIENLYKNFQPVNILAIEEFEELNKKLTFLTSQKDDLINGKNILLNLIKEIDTNIHEKFFLAYNSIDENFNKMCMETLNNSEGKLFITNKDNFDECGVEIFVKFKNKKRQSLSLLSGGEKSMVAIAFIMAIFMYKPSPFTFLDEIEAALDEKNTKKLIGKLKEFTDKSQFILITHNKDTMRESESIFGVTMNKEIGISKVVPVKF